MAWLWNPWALAMLVGPCCAWAMAAFVYLASPHRALNRVLALLLLFEGFEIATVGLIMMTDSPALVRGIDAAQGEAGPEPGTSRDPRARSDARPITSPACRR